MRSGLRSQESGGRSQGAEVRGQGAGVQSSAPGTEYSPRGVQPSRRNSKLSVSLALIVMLFFGSFAAGQPPKESRPRMDDVQDFVFMSAERPLLIRAHVQIDGKSYRDAWNDYVTHVFKFLDVSNDGSVSKVELERMPPMPFLTGGLVALGGRMTSSIPMESIDTSKDGKVSRDELAAYLRRNGVVPFQIGSATANPLGARVITIGGDQPASSPEIVNDAIFALLDVNKDGKLSKEELLDTPAQFAARDANEDEMLTASEIAPNSGPRSSNFEAIKVAVRDGGMAPAGDGRLLLVNSGEPGSDLARQLLARYGSKEGKPGSKKLTAAQLGLDAATFARLDADKDGALDSEELAMFGRRTPDLELTFRIGTKADGTADVEGSIRMAGSDASMKNNAGALALEMGVTRVEFKVGSAASNPNVRLSFRVRDQYVDQFKGLDSDNNGYLDEREANSNRLFQPLFKALDADQDGMLYEKELVAYLDRVEDLQKAIQSGCVTLSLSDRGTGLFDMMDPDKDGRLSLREMRRVAELLPRLDRNGDGLLARAEVPRNFEMRLRSGPAGGASDLNNVVVVSKFGRNDPSQSPDRGAGPIWFRKMDANRDGDLSRREFLGTDEDFKKLDTDGDGLISADEAAKADPDAGRTPMRRR